MKYIIFTVFLIISFVCVTPKSKDKIDLHKIVDEINRNPKSTWKADTYGFKSIDPQEIVESRLGTKLPPIKFEDFQKQNLHFKNNIGEWLNFEKAKFASFNFFLPKSYDARQRYPQCRSIGLIRDQSKCGSCWSVSAASAVSDRVCIKTNGTHNVLLSANFVTACNKKNYGCRGGYLDEVWKFLEEEGCITGGGYESDDGCQTYTIRPCGYPVKMSCAFRMYRTPKCKGHECNNEWYKSETEKDVYKVKNAGLIGNNFLGIFNEYLMRNEIYNNGPIQVGFYVFEDFFTYKSGIYQHEWKLFEEPLGGHAVKVIGWGEEKGVKYWILANSWGEEWGENGLFRIVRGENNCLIEGMAYAGDPIIPSSKIKDDSGDSDDSDDSDDDSKSM